MVIVGGVTDMDGVTTTNERQVEGVECLWQIGDHPIRMVGRYDNTETQCTIKEFDAGLNPLSVVYSHGYSGLVKLCGIRSSNTDRKSEIGIHVLTVDMSI